MTQILARCNSLAVTIHLQHSATGGGAVVLPHGSRPPRRRHSTDVSGGCLGARPSSRRAGHASSTGPPGDPLHYRRPSDCRRAGATGAPTLPRRPSDDHLSESGGARSSRGREPLPPWSWARDVPADQPRPCPLDLPPLWAAHRAVRRVGLGSGPTGRRGVRFLDRPSPPRHLRHVCNVSETWPGQHALTDRADSDAKERVTASPSTGSARPRDG